MTSNINTYYILQGQGVAHLAIHMSDWLPFLNLYLARCFNIIITSSLNCLFLASYRPLNHPPLFLPILIWNDPMFPGIFFSVDIQPKICINYRKHGSSSFSHTFNCVSVSLFLISNYFIYTKIATFYSLIPCNFSVRTLGYLKKIYLNPFLPMKT